ncbi:F-box protein SKIP8 [Cucurbita argyrosperma subsp. argyrosperma]|nr:F-box protein SKIP8 [Cucurbita argyrosperma subsp. argyrosperma]
MLQVPSSMALHTSSLCCHGYVTFISNRKSVRCSQSCEVFHHVPLALPKQYDIGLVKASIGGYGFVSPSIPRCLGSTIGNFRPCKQSTRMLSFRPCQLKAENSSGESITLDAETLKQDLQNAIADEDYARAAEIRDTLKALQEDSKASVFAANAKFYESFRNGDLAAMQTLWARGDSVCCVHPGMRGISGYDNVITSWEYVWANYEFPLEIQLKDVEVHARGDVGYVTCVELVKTKGSSWGGQFVTNVFERINGQWFICIHHASPIDL